MSPSNYKEEKLNRHEARKQVSKIVSQYPENIRFSNHAQDELRADDLTTVDAWNVLKSPDSRINIEGEWEKYCYRYRLETRKIMIVISFWIDGTGINVVTAWDKTTSKRGR